MVRSYQAAYCFKTLEAPESGFLPAKPGTTRVSRNFVPGYPGTRAPHRGTFYSRTLRNVEKNSCTKPLGPLSAKGFVDGASNFEKPVKSENALPGNPGTSSLGVTVTRDSVPRTCQGPSLRVTQCQWQWHLLGYRGRVLLGQ
eukprot:3795926-Rhodomonas_salina.1